MKITNRNNALIISPCYFTVPYVFDSFSIKYSIVKSRRINMCYYLPTLSKKYLKNFDIIWITNPVYCTSQPYFHNDINNFIENITNKKTIIVIDECLLQTELSTNIRHENVIKIKSPHKSICINGIKFAAVILPTPYQDTIDNWSDVWQGCLPFSSIIAIEHFLSDKFTKYRNKFQNGIEVVYNKLKSFISETENIYMDEYYGGYFTSVYVPKIPASMGVDYKFMHKIAIDTGIIFISGFRNRFPNECGFSFRINLAAFDNNKIKSILKLLSLLDHYSNRSFFL